MFVKLNYNDNRFWTKSQSIWVYSYSATTFIFDDSFNSNFWFLLHLGVNLFFGALMGFFLGWGMVRKLFWGQPLYLNNFHFLCFLEFWRLILTEFWVNFILFGALWAIFGVGVGFENCIGVHSCTWTTFIFYASFRSDIFDFDSMSGSFLTFWGPNGLFLGSG